MKQEPLDEKNPLDSPQEIIEVDGDEDRQEQVPMKESTKTKNLQVSIETLTLKPVIPIIMNHPQTARKGRGFCPGWAKIGWTGKMSDNTDTDNKPRPSYN